MVVGKGSTLDWQVRPRESKRDIDMNLLRHFLNCSPRSKAWQIGVGAFYMYVCICLSVLKTKTQKKLMFVRLLSCISRMRHDISESLINMCVYIYVYIYVHSSIYMYISHNYLYIYISYTYIFKLF